MNGRLRGYGAAFWCAAGWIVVVVASAATASWLPVDPNRFDPANGLDAPSFRHPFGTTRLGEDLFAQIIHGSRAALLVAVGAALIAFVVGVPVGLAAGYFGGRVDRAITVVLDAVVAFPALVLVSTIVLFRGQTLTNVVGMIGILAAPLLARITRTATRTIVGRDFVAAARLAGAGHGRILLRELAPNVTVPILAYTMLVAGVAVLVEGGLSFVGLGVPLDKMSWGRLVASGRESLQEAWWWSMGPSLVIFLTILSLNFVSDQLQQRWLFGRPVATARRRRTAGDHATSRGTWNGVDQAGTASTVRDGDESRPASLDVRGLHVSIPTVFGTVQAVDGVSVRLESGRLLAVVGESGAGKTMLGRAILGIAPDHAVTKGAIAADGLDLLALDPEQLRRKRGRDIAVVFQDPMTALDPVMKVGWQVAEPARVHLGMGRAEARRHAVELLAAVGVGEPERRFSQFPHQLSGGLRQRVAIALALSCGPKLLIADEPTSALDVTVQAQIMSLLARVRRERNMAVLFITHDLVLAATHADEIAVMYAGRVVERGPAAEVYAAPRMPYTKALLEAAPRLAGESRRRLPAIAGQPPILVGLGAGCAFAPRCTYSDDECRAESPPLAPDADGRSVACWHPVR